MARRTKADALATRDQILDAAERVFQRCGVRSASLQAVALEAGLTRGAIYWHFQNKLDLFDAMLQRVTLPLMAQFQALPAPDAQPLDHLRRSMQEAFRQTVHEPAVRRVFEIAVHKVEYVDELLPLRARDIALRRMCRQDMERLLGQAAFLGHIAADTPLQAAAIGLHALIDGLMHNWLLEPAAFDLEQVGALALDAYLHGLAATGAGAA